MKYLKSNVMKKVFCAFVILSVSACLSAQTTVSSFAKLGYIKQDTATISSATPAMTMDPLCEKYPWITPYVYCLNNPVKYIDPNGEDVYLLFYIVGNSRGDEAFKAAAQNWLAHYMVPSRQRARAQLVFLYKDNGCETNRKRGADRKC